MRTYDEVRRRLKNLKQEQAALERELREREAEIRTYLRTLVERDSGQEQAFKDEVLRWLRGPKATTTIKNWVLLTVGSSPDNLTVRELRKRFRDEFGERRLPSLRQYLTKQFGVEKKGDILALNKTGQAKFRELKNK